MCTNISVNLPTVVSFLLLYPLKCGCVITLMWTATRAVFYLGFFIVAMMEVFLPRTPIIGPIFPAKPAPPTSDEQYFFVFMAFIVMIVTECIIGMYLIYLGIGLYYHTPGRIVQYLVCRFITWSLEILMLVILCLTHHSLIGWYLAFLMFIILEFYGFIVVYSYYVDMLEKRKTESMRIATVSNLNTQHGKPALCLC